jgi:hypothetical protein
VATQYLRSDVVRALVSGDRDCAERYAAACDALRSFGFSYFGDLPAESEHISAVLWSPFADAMYHYYDVDGVPIRPEGAPWETPDWKGFRARYPGLPQRSVEDVRADWLAVHHALQVSGGRGGIVLYHSGRYRVHGESEYRARLMEHQAEMVHTLAPLGWPVFAVPWDAPPLSPTCSWAHYDQDWARRFVGKAVAALKRGA